MCTSRVTSVVAARRASRAENERGAEMRKKNEKGDDLDKRVFRCNKNDDNNRERSKWGQ